jgi:hypothetical protein
LPTFLIGSMNGRRAQESGRRRYGQVAPVAVAPDLKKFRGIATQYESPKAFLNVIHQRGAALDQNRQTRP